MANTNLNNANADSSVPRSWQKALLIAVGIALAAVNLRTAVTSVGALLPTLQNSLSMSSAVAGLLTALPVICFAGIGAIAAWLGGKIGEHRALTLALFALLVGIVVRSLSNDIWVFIFFSALALSGCAVGNVLLPALVKKHFPNHIGVMTTVYSTGLALGTTLAAGISVPVAKASSSWRVGLGVWALLVIVAIAPWLGLLKHDVYASKSSAIKLKNLLQSKLAWAMAIYFGSQSLQAYIVFGWLSKIYVDAGMSHTSAGIMLAIMTGVQVPVSLFIPVLATKLKSQRVLVVFLVCLYVIGYGGLFFIPLTFSWLWAGLIGFAGGAFPLALTMIGLRAKSAAGTGALSGFAQSIGYLLSGIGPLFIGILYGLTGGWTAPFILMFAALVPQLLAGLYCSANRYVEDELVK